MLKVACWYPLTVDARKLLVGTRSCAFNKMIILCYLSQKTCKTLLDQPKISVDIHDPAFGLWISQANQDFVYLKMECLCSKCNEVHKFFINVTKCNSAGTKFDSVGVFENLRYIIVIKVT